MKRVLIDTHVWLWSLNAPKKLSRKVKKLLEDRSSEIFVSTCSLWEIASKWSTGALELPAPPDVFLPEQLSVDGFHLLDIQPRHVLAVSKLAWHHRDPFDRLLVVQSQIEGLPLATNDERFDDYGISRFW